MTQNELNKIIENHQHYLNKDIDGWEFMRADLSYKNLSGLDLRNAKLYKANLNNADLSSADLRKADLCEADLSEADLRKADLSGADLRNVNLREADMYGAYCCYANLNEVDLRNANLYRVNFNKANLREVDLRNADLRKANFRHTDLSGADFYRADLSGVDLSYANLYRTDLWHAELLGTKIDYPIACPETGSFIGYKKASYGYIVKLQICKNARRSSATTKKCRCSKALVLSIENRNGSYSGLQEIESIYNTSFVYRVGEIAEVPNFDDNRWYECAPGIHFFMDRQDAVEY